MCQLYAAFAYGDILMKSMQENYQIKTGIMGDGEAYKYVTTGSVDKVELKAAGTPAYYGASATKGMPATGDSSMPLVFGVAALAVLAASAGAFSLRKSRAEEGSAVK